ncbi:MAG: OmpA family protein [Alphaproteobacteria bacterium]|nr:OmpA family protein [Alphaproteobacteria bacterium]
MIALWLATALAWAQEADPIQPAVDAQLLRPSIDSLATFAVDPTDRIDGQRAFARVVFGYAREPLVALAEDGRRVALVRDMVHADLVGAYQLGPFRLGVDLPVVYGRGELAEGGGLGDLRIDARGTLLTRRRFPVGLALAASVVTPTSTARTVSLGSGGVSWDARVLLDGQAGPAWLGLSLGVGGAPRVSLDNLDWKVQLTPALATAVRVHRDVQVSAELIARVGVTGAPQWDTTPMEALVGTTVDTRKGVAVRFGVGAGLSPGLGAAVARGLIGLDYLKPPPPPPVDPCAPDPTAPGCPDARVTVGVDVRDLDGRAIPDAVVTVDGSLPIEGGWALPPGSYVVTARAPGFLPRQQTVDVPDVATLTAQMLLQRDPGVGQGTVRLEVVDDEGAPVSAAWATTDAHGDLEGGTGALVLPAGRNYVTVTAPGRGAVALRLDVEADSTDTVQVMLARPRVTVRDTFLELDGKVFFDTDKATIKAESHPLLREVAAAILGHPDLLRIRIEGHTDSRGSDLYNLQLSQARAESVRQFLIDSGVQPDRLVAVGLGESQPIDDGDDEVAWSVNRRVQLLILERTPTTP